MSEFEIKQDFNDFVCWHVAAWGGVSYFFGVMMIIL